LTSEKLNPSRGLSGCGCVGTCNITKFNPTLSSFQLSTLTEEQTRSLQASVEEGLKAAIDTTKRSGSGELLELIDFIQDATSTMEQLEATARMNIFDPGTSVSPRMETAYNQFMQLAKKDSDLIMHQMTPIQKAYSRVLQVSTTKVRNIFNEVDGLLANAISAVEAANQSDYKDDSAFEVLDSLESSSVRLLDLLKILLNHRTSGESSLENQAEDLFEFSAEVEEKFIPRSTIGARETRVRCEKLYVYALKRIMCLAAELAAHNVSEDNSGRRKIIRTSTEYLQFSLNVTTDLDAFCENITGEDDDLGPEYFGFIRVNYLTWQN
jgi:hypothetical protein